MNTSYTYDTLSRLLSVLHNGGALPGSTSYTYDAAGNRLTKTAVQEASPNPVSVLSNYSYDNIYELTQAVVGGTVAEGYSYDAVGNRLTSAGPTSYNYNASNELTSTSAATYTYDNNGNTTSKTDTTGTTYYTWDFENRLSQRHACRARAARSISTTTRLAGALGRVPPAEPRFTPTTATTSRGIEQWRQRRWQTTRRVPGIDEPLAMYRGGGNLLLPCRRLGLDHLADGQRGNLAASYVYDSFGNLTASTGTITNPFQYTAPRIGFRNWPLLLPRPVLSPIVGRFISEDPIRFGGGINFYDYVSNGAPNFADPTGTIIKICSRGGWNDILGALGGVANHAYLVDTRNGHNCGRGDQGPARRIQIPTGLPAWRFPEIRGTKTR